MKSAICGILLFILAMALLSAGSPAVVLAERYYEEQEYLEGYYDAGYYEDGVVNYLNEDSWYHNGSFVHYLEDGFTSRVGVDVSKWNGDIDWFSLAAQGITFAIIRVGYRGYETGDIVLDERFYDYIEGATQAGLEVGLYFCTQAIDEEEAREEALFAVQQAAGYNISLPIYYDTEDVQPGESRTEVMATANYTLNALAFCETVEAMGYSAGVYASHDWIRKNLDLNSLSSYEIWYANYSVTPGREYGFDMWQYTNVGDLYGCDTYLDMDVRVSQLW